MSIKRHEPIGREPQFTCGDFITSGKKSRDVERLSFVYCLQAIVIAGLPTTYHAGTITRTANSQITAIILSIANCNSFCGRNKIVSRFAIVFL